MCFPYPTTSRTAWLIIVFKEWYLWVVIWCLLKIAIVLLFWKDWIKVLKDLWYFLNKILVILFYSFLFVAYPRLGEVSVLNHSSARFTPGGSRGERQGAWTKGKGRRENAQKEMTGNSKGREEIGKSRKERIKERQGNEKEEREKGVEKWKQKGRLDKHE